MLKYNGCVSCDPVVSAIMAPDRMARVTVLRGTESFTSYVTAAYTFQQLKADAARHFSIDDCLVVFEGAPLREMLHQGAARRRYAGGGWVAGSGTGIKAHDERL